MSKKIAVTITFNAEDVESGEVMNETSISLPVLDYPAFLELQKAMFADVSLKMYEYGISHLPTPS